MSVASTPSNSSGPVGPDGLAAMLAVLEQASQALVGVPVADLEPSACLEATDRLAVIADRLRLTTNQLVGRVDRTGQARKSGYGSTAAWLRNDAKRSGGDAARMRRAGRELPRLPKVQAAAEAGDISGAMVDQICAATALFRKDEDVSVVEDALLRLALETRDVRLVAMAGGHLRQILDPDGKLSDDEKAYRKRHMTVRPEENGGVSGWFYLPPEPAAKLRALLDKYAKPSGKNGEDDRTQAERNADVLIQIINQLVTVDMVAVTSADSLPDDPADYDQPPWTDDSDEETPTHQTPDKTHGEDRDQARPDRADPGGHEGRNGGDDGCGGGPGDRGEADDSQTNDHDGDDDGGCEDCSGDPVGDAAYGGHLGDRNDTGAPDDSADSPAYTNGAGDTGESDAGIDPDAEDDPDADEGVRDADGLTATERLREMISKLRPAPVRLPAEVTDATDATVVQNWGRSWRDMVRRLPAVMLPTGVPVPQPVLPRLMHISRLYRLIHGLKGIGLSRGTRQIQPRERAAVLALYSTCAYDACQVPAQWCEIDHPYAWAYFKRTRLHELLPACDHHNRDRWNNPWKYKLQRLPDGRWHFKTIKRYRN